MIGLEKSSLRSVSVTPSVVPYERWDYDANGNCIYMGWNQVTSDTTATSWIIKKITYDGSNNPTVAGTASRVAWDDRTTSTYTA